MKNVIGLVMILFVFGASAQDSTGIRLIEKSSIEVDSAAYWNMDAMGNYFISLNDEIFKIDTSGTLRFSQSVKAFGETSALVSVNTFKLVHFSEEQQTICYMDNSLTIYEGSFELAERGIVNGTLVSSSGQPNQLWVLDQLNSTLNLLAMIGNQGARKITNLNGLLDVSEVTQMKEAGNKLFLLTPEGIFVLDIYGSLLEFIREENIEYFDANASHLYTLKADKLNIIDMRTGATTAITIPVSGVFQVKIVNGALFARTPKNVHKFELQMLD